MNNNEWNIIRVGNLTANLPSDRLTIFAGLHDGSNIQESGGQHRKAKRIQVHPDFNPQTERADIAILTLAVPMKMTQTVQVVCITNQAANANSQCHATGYGSKRKTGKGKFRSKP